MTTEKDLEELFGPLAPYSEHKVGDIITYEREGVRYTGTILWVCARGQMIDDDQEHPLRYIVENAYGGWPDMVYPQEIIIEEWVAMLRPGTSNC